MKMSAKRIALLVLSSLILVYVVYSVVNLILQVPLLREETLKMFDDPQISEIIRNPEGIVNVVIGISVAASCLGCILYVASGVLGICAALNKYRGGAHIVLVWIWLIFDCLGFALSLLRLILGAQFDFSLLIVACLIGVAIAFIVVGRQIKDGND